LKIRKIRDRIIFLCIFAIIFKLEFNLGFAIYFIIWHSIPSILDPNFIYGSFLLAILYPIAGTPCVLAGFHYRNRTSIFI
jgi:hypothetical protein